MPAVIDSYLSRILGGGSLAFAEASALVRYGDLSALLLAADTVRERFCGNDVHLCSIVNARCGKCSENCAFCAQSAYHSTNVSSYPLLSEEAILERARECEEEGVSTFSLVTSGKGMGGDDFISLLHVCERIKKETSLTLCASLGIISFDQAVALKEAGVATYHHNLESCRSFFPSVCTTHAYDDRVATIRNARKAGLRICSGGIIGLGETVGQRLRLAFELKDLAVLSIPLNVLMPISGTPLASQPPLAPEEILRAVALFRLINPRAVIRFAGGRKALGDKQAQALQGGLNGLLTGNYLTTVGNTVEDDKELLMSLSRCIL